MKVGVPKTPPRGVQSHDLGRSAAFTGRVEGRTPLHDEDSKTEPSVRKTTWNEPLEYEGRNSLLSKPPQTTVQAWTTHEATGKPKGRLRRTQNQREACRHRGRKKKHKGDVPVLRYDSTKVTPPHDEERNRPSKRRGSSTVQIADVDGLGQPEPGIAMEIMTGAVKKSVRQEPKERENEVGVMMASPHAQTEMQS
ncbi:hypothetical protein R1flu_011680 [Riccia fluitans]|uniref:Uncharacterized protein n=1 Tax=Riccia fluitans TaxID=41844 RepID=A0ABD1Z8Q0_9MARC